MSDATHDTLPSLVLETPGVRDRRLAISEALYRDLISIPRSDMNDTDEIPISIPMRYRYQ